LEAFLDNIFSFPTVIFTVPTIVIVLFWFSAFLGLMDIEIFDADVDGGADSGAPDMDGDATSSSDLLSNLGLDGVPLTVAITLIDVYAFAFTYVAKQQLAPLLDGVLTATVAGTVIALGAVFIALPVAAISCRPLRKVFVTHEAPAKSDLIGKICTVSSGSVTETFGQAASEDGTVVVNVRAESPNEFSRGDRIVLLGFDADSDSFTIVAHDELMNES
jgi:hypothetical protein